MARCRAFHGELMSARSLPEVWSVCWAVRQAFPLGSEGFWGLHGAVVGGSTELEKVWGESMERLLGIPPGAVNMPTRTY